MITFIKNNFGELLISCLVIMVIATFVVNLYYRESKSVNMVIGLISQLLKLMMVLLRKKLV
jgi:quinol-cytochrome oxidoreductase complex cytochrome b subunit